VLKSFYPPKRKKFKKVETVHCRNIDLENFCKFLSIFETKKLEKEKNKNKQKTSQGKTITALSCRNIDLEYFCKFLSISETKNWRKKTTKKQTLRGKTITAPLGR